MSGVEILNKIPLTKATNESFISIIIFYIIGTIILSIICVNMKEIRYYDTIAKWVGSLMCGAITNILFTIMYACLITTLWTEPTGEYQYQVTIDKSVSMTEFDSKYIILKQDGKIYTIEER